MQVKVSLPPPALRLALKERVNTIRLARLAQPMEFEGHWYDNTQQTVQNLTAVVAAVSAGISLPDGFCWRTADNENVPHDAASITRLAAAFLAYTQACYTHSWALKEAIDAADDPAKIELVNGWP